MENTNTINNTYTDKLNKLFELRTKFDEIKQAFEDSNRELTDAIHDLECEIKVDAMNEKMTLYGHDLMAVYNKGRMTWDGKALNRMSEKYPEILDCAHYGDPTISFRKVIRKEEDDTVNE